MTGHRRNDCNIFELIKVFTPIKKGANTALCVKCMCVLSFPPFSV